MTLALPFFFYFASKRWRMFEFVHIPVILTGALIWAPFNLSNVCDMCSTPSMPTDGSHRCYRRCLSPTFSTCSSTLGGAFTPRTLSGTSSSKCMLTPEGAVMSDVFFQIRLLPDAVLVRFCLGANFDIDWDIYSNRWCPHPPCQHGPR